MIVTFSNRKGRVGKSCLCMALANYWASNNIPVKVIDVDPQQSIYSTRERDLRMYAEKPKYDILKFDLSNQLNEFLECIQVLKESEYHVLFDTPTGVDSVVFMNVVKISDYVIVPFQFETISVDMTGLYSRSLQLLEKMFPMQHRTIVFVPNLIDTSKDNIFNFKVGEEWGADIEFSFGLKSPNIYSRTYMRKMNTLFLTPEELFSVTPCFEYLTNVIHNCNVLPVSAQINIEGNFANVLN